MDLKKSFDKKALLESPQAMVDLMEVLAQQVESLEAELKTVKASQSVGQSTSQSTPSHPVGLCQSKECATCTSQGTAIATSAYSKGREDLLALQDELALLVGGQPLQEKIATVMAQGLTLKQRNEQQVMVTR